jgi:hypothetical protein
MKKISTRTTKKVEKVASQKLTIGLDLGDRWSWYCVLDEAGEGCWRCFAACYQRAILALASTGSPTASPKSSKKPANSAQPEIGQRLAG